MKYSGIRSFLPSLMSLALLATAITLAPLAVPIALAGAVAVPGFALWHQTSDQFTLNLASFHSPKNSTWSWCLSLIRPRSVDEGRWLSCYFHGMGQSWQAGIQIAHHEIMFTRQTYHLRRHAPLMC